MKKSADNIREILLKHYCDLCLARCGCSCNYNCRFDLRRWRSRGSSRDIENSRGMHRKTVLVFALIIFPSILPFLFSRTLFYFPFTSHASALLNTKKAAVACKFHVYEKFYLLENSAFFMIFLEELSKNFMGNALNKGSYPRDFPPKSFITSAKTLS